MFCQASLSSVPHFYYLWFLTSLARPQRPASCFACLLRVVFTLAAFAPSPPLFSSCIFVGRGIIDAMYIYMPPSIRCLSPFSHICRVVVVTSMASRCPCNAIRITPSKPNQLR
ncbi:hypothetical protein BD309DRAFT_245788 [Dichomitus squalens]|nr:hypothetical protein BD309DRAFT_245788 [Dichomitus squalens]